MAKGKGKAKGKGTAKSLTLFSVVDNNTWNNSHIALVGKAMSSNESAAYDIMTELDVDYVLVIFGGVIGYSGDDINKFLWMVRIAEGEHPQVGGGCYNVTSLRIILIMTYF